MSKYEPYKLDSFKDLMALGYSLGWYGGTKTLFEVKMIGAFEGWSGRASETWEQRFIVSTGEIIEDGKTLLPKLESEADTLDDACKKLIEKIKATK